MTPARMAKLESSMRIVLDFQEAFNRQDVPAMMQHMGEDCLFEDTEPAPDGRRYTGKEAITQYWQDFFLASPRAHMDIEEIFSLGTRCVMRWKYSWVDGAGNGGHLRRVDIFQTRDNLISEMYSYVKG